MKSKLLLFILGLSISFLTQAQLPFTYEGFDYAEGAQINGQTGGFGWQGGWLASTGAESAYTATSTNPFSYTNGATLPVTPGHMIGSSTGNIIGRYFNTATNGPFASYLNANGSIAAKSGVTQQLYIPIFMTKNQNNDDQVYFSFTNGLDNTSIQNPTISFGYFGVRSNNGNLRYWTLRLGTAYIMLTPIVAGQKEYFVSNFYFQNLTAYINIYRNSVIQNGQPTNYLSASMFSSTSYPGVDNPFKSLLFYSEGSGGSIDEILVGPNFNSVGINILPPAVLNGVNATGNGTPGTSTTLNDTWRLNGNGATNPATQFIGTTDNHDLNFKTNNVNRVAVSSTGDVTINSLQGTGTSIPTLDVTGKLSRIGIGTVGQYLQYTASGPAWSNVSNEWNTNTFTSTNPVFTGSLYDLVNNSKARITLQANQTHVTGDFLASNGVQIGGADLFQTNPDKVNGLPAYGMGLLMGDATNGFGTFNPIQISGTNGIIMLDGTYNNTNIPFMIKGGKVGINSSKTQTLTEALEVTGKIKATSIVLPDGEITSSQLASAASNIPFNKTAPLSDSFGDLLFASENWETSSGWANQWVVSDGTSLNTPTTNPINTVITDKGLITTDKYLVTSSTDNHQSIVRNIDINHIPTAYKGNNSIKLTDGNPISFGFIFKGNGFTLDIGNSGTGTHIYLNGTINSNSQLIIGGFYYTNANAGIPEFFTSLPILLPSPSYQVDPTKPHFIVFSLGSTTYADPAAPNLIHLYTALDYYAPYDASPKSMLTPPDLSQVGGHLLHPPKTLAYPFDFDQLQIEPTGSSIDEIRIGGDYASILPPKSNYSFNSNASFNYGLNVNHGLNIQDTLSLYGGGMNGTYLQKLDIFTDPTGVVIYAPKSPTDDHTNITFAFKGADATSNSISMKSDGSMLIGNAGPTSPNYSNYKLAVHGKIVGTQIISSANAWYDYVFDEHYKLKSLKEVETYIKENKHLPDIPSEKEVLKNGVDLAEMNGLLLKKIEEMSLYMIDLEKNVTDLRKRMKLLEKGK